jgi:cytochrome c-type biogenesis protein CcmH/NrfF
MSRIFFARLSHVILSGAKNLLLCLLLAGASAALAVDEESVKKVYPSEGKVGQEFRDIAAELRCPTCTGLSVLESDAKFSVQIKDIVLEKVNEGKSRDEILQYFTERYGPWILRAPPKSGVNLVAWAVPLALLTVGPLLVWLLVWRRKKVIVDFKVRATDDIISEMNQRIESFRNAAGGRP